jgi:hypothetical protein
MVAISFLIFKVILRTYLALQKTNPYKTHQDSPCCDSKRQSWIHSGRHSKSILGAFMAILGRFVQEASNER